MKKINLLYLQVIPIIILWAVYGISEGIDTLLFLVWPTISAQVFQYYKIRAILKAPEYLKYYYISVGLPWIFGVLCFFFPGCLTDLNILILGFAYTILYFVPVYIANSKFRKDYLDSTFLIAVLLIPFLFEKFKKILEENGYQIIDTRY